MKKFLLLLIVFLVSISCLRVTSKPITGDFSPIEGVLPYFFYRGGNDIPKLNKGNSLIFYLGKGSGEFSMKIYLPKYSRVQFILKDGNGKFDNIRSSEVSIVKVTN